MTIIQSSGVKEISIKLLTKLHWTCVGQIEERRMGTGGSCRGEREEEELVDTMNMAAFVKTTTSKLRINEQIVTDQARAELSLNVD